VIDLTELERKRRIEHEARMDEAFKAYTSEFLQSLADEFKIDRAKRDRLREVLRFTAWLYRNPLDEEYSKPKKRFLRAELTHVEDLADKLASSIASLSGAAAEVLWFPQRRLLSELPLVGSDTVTKYGHTVIRYRRSDDAEEIRFLREQQIVEAVAVLRNLARHAIESLKHDRSGPMPDEPLRMWIINIQRFWQRDLGRRFTYDSHRGKGLTNAYRFCWAATRPLDKGITQSALGTAMRKAIKLHPNTTKRGS
jgi:hypothetical protein